MLCVSYNELIHRGLLCLGIRQLECITSPGCEERERCKTLPKGPLDLTSITILTKTRLRPNDKEVPTAHSRRLAGEKHQLDRPMRFGEGDAKATLSKRAGPGGTDTAVLSVCSGVMHNTCI